MSTVTEESSRHFDAPRAESITGATVAVLRGHWKRVVALIVNVSILQTMAFCLIGIDAIGSDRIDASIASMSIFVAAEADASAAEVDALGPLIRAVPGVSNATLRSKDDAVRSLIASGLPPPDGRNPLPDVWVVRLEAATVGKGRSVATTWSEKRQALASLPRVTSVSTDERWVATIDRGIDRWQMQWPTALTVGLGTLALAVACTAFLAGTGFASRSDRAERVNTGLQVLAIVSVLVACASTVMSYAVSWTVIAWFREAAVSGAAWSFSQLVSTRQVQVGSITVVTLLIIAGAFAASHLSKE